MKTAIVTGTTRGIGRAMTLLLLSKGYFVIGVYKNSDTIAHELENEYQENFRAVKADIGKELEIEKIFDVLKETSESLDVLVNNAGIDLFGEIETYSTKDWKTMMDVNLTSVFLMSKRAIPFLKKVPNSVIVNVTSRLGNLESLESTFVPYSVTKAGVTALSMGLALELKEKNIRVNAFVPAPTKTDLFDEVFTSEEESELKAKGKLATPEEEAELMYNIINNPAVNGEIIYDPRIQS